MRNLWFALGAFVFLGGQNVWSADSVQMWQVARAVPVVPGAPRHGDVSMRSLRPHPSRPGDPYDTLEMARQFHLTRLEWTYEMDAAFVKKAKALGLVVGGALEDESSDASGSKEFGRVTGQDGQLKKHKWFPEGRWVGCANAPEYMEAAMFQARKQIDAGVDVMQQDDPSMAVRCVPPYCYCDYCKADFVKYQQEHGPNASYDQFQKDSIVAFHKELHRRIDAYAGHHIPFSNNTGIVRYGAMSWVASAFDYILCEIDRVNVQPVQLYKNMQAVHGVPLSFQYREPSVPDERRGLALFYALGTTMLMPWDVYLNNSNRYFGKPSEYADLSGFIRANAKYLDDYEDAAVAGPGFHEARYGGSVPVQISGGTGAEFAFARAHPGDSNAPVAIHLVEWSSQGQPFVLRLHTLNFFGGRPLRASLLTPPPYDAAMHHQAQETHDFSNLSSEVSLPATIDGDETVVQIPALSPWGILLVRP
jgi:hypothetical protein